MFRLLKHINLSYKDINLIFILSNIIIYLFDLQLEKIVL